MKRDLKESQFKKNYVVVYSDGIRSVKGFDRYEDAVLFLQGKVNGNKVRDIAIFNKNFKNTTDINNLLMWWDDGRGYFSNVSENNPSLLKKKYKKTNSVTEKVEKVVKLIETCTNKKVVLQEKQIYEDVTNFNLEQLKDKFNEIGYDFQITEYNSRPVVRIYKFTPRAKYSTQKMIVNTYATDPEAYLKKWLDNILTNLQSKEDYKEKKRAEKAEVGNPYKVGDILYDTWGYEQTNVEFYKVVGVKGMSVDIVEIGHIDTGQPSGPDSAYVLPDPDNEIGEVITKRCGRVYDGYPTIKLNSVITLSIFKPEQHKEGVYKSWYY